MSADLATIRIEDPDDPRIAIYRDIRERDLIRRQGHFIAEGRTVLHVLVDQDRFPVHSLLVLENRLAGLSGLLETLPANIPVYCATQPVLDAIAGFHMHRGILAIANIPGDTAEMPNEMPADWKTLLLLSAISNHDNMGSIFRNAAAFGVDAVLLDPQCCDPLYRKAVRASMGGCFKLPYLHAPRWPAELRELQAAGYRVLALHLQGSVAHSTAIAAAPGAADPPPLAVVVGAEYEGVGKEAAEICDARVRIPMSGAMDTTLDSLNVNVAAAIVLERVFTLNRSPDAAED